MVGWCPLDFLNKIYLKFDKKKGQRGKLYIIGKTAEQGNNRHTYCVLRDIVPQERCIRIEFLEFTFPKGCNQSLMSLAEAGNCA